MRIFERSGATRTHVHEAVFEIGSREPKARSRSILVRRRASSKPIDEPDAACCEERVNEKVHA
jgi:hypothetical protein